MQPKSIPSGQTHRKSRLAVAVRFCTHAMQIRSLHLLFCILALLLAAVRPLAAQQADIVNAPDYGANVQPILLKYCGNCHSGSETEGDFSLQTFSQLMKGTPEGTVVLSGNANNSKLIQLMRGSLEPKMPPDGEPQPTTEEIELVARWIDSGSSPPKSVPLTQRLTVPKIPSLYRGTQPLTSLALLPNDQLATGRFTTAEIIDSIGRKTLHAWNDISGKVTQLRLSRDGRFLVLASGIEGVGGEAIIVEIASAQIVGKVQGHSDILYAATISPDNSILATAGYDRQIILWNWKSGEQLRVLQGHNGAIYDLDFDPSGRLIASASADETVKVWQVASGLRMDTLSQGEKEQYTVRFSNDGKYLFAGGADRKIRKWEIVSFDQPTINPILESRFAHEGPVLALRLAPNDQALVSIGQDRRVKQWNPSDMSLAAQLFQSAEFLAAAEVASDSSHVVVAPSRGDLIRIPLSTNSTKENAPLAMELPAVDTTAGNDAPMNQLDETEPNSSIAQAQAVSLPVTIKGVIDQTSSEDIDYFRFSAKAGEKWIFEVDASRSGSKLDSRIAILNPDGSPVKRLLLQAVRESYFTFRGKDSDTSDDFRLHKWDEMELNEYLYAGGEVVKLWLYPRGPDSGFKVYPGYGNRYTYFDTTPTSHPLGGAAYVVRPIPVGDEPLPNGLPLFPIYFENDDESLRRYGRDSRLEFTPPSEGEYLVAIRDSGAFSSPENRYSLICRKPKPDFEVALDSGKDLTLSKQRGREFGVTATRIDGYNGPIEIKLEGLPEGFVATQPLTIQEGQNKAFGTIYATDHAKLPEGKDQIEVRLVATATIGANTIDHPLPTPIKVKMSAPDAKPEVAIRVRTLNANDGAELVEIVIRPGTTVSAKLIIDRFGHEGAVGFGNEDSGRNLPHGVFIDNIGLNGLLLPDQQTEREFFITAASWVPNQTCLFHLRSQTAGNPTSLPILLRVER